MVHAAYELQMRNLNSSPGSHSGTVQTAAGKSTNITPTPALTRLLYCYVGMFKYLRNIADVK